MNGNVPAEDAAVQIAEKHLDGFVRLIALPVPLLVIVTLGLATADKEVISAAGIDLPRRFAEVCVRGLILLFLMQSANHLIAIRALLLHYPKSKAMRAAISWHPGLLNPFFVTDRPISDPSEPIGCLSSLLIPRFFMSQFAVGVVVGFAFGFRTAFSSGLFAHWYNLGSRICWLLRISCPNVDASFEYWSKIYASGSYYLLVTDTVLFALTAVVVVGLFGIIVSILVKTGDNFDASARFMLGLIGAFMAATYLSAQLAAGLT